MGKEGAHASFNVVSGGARARAVAFRTSPRRSWRARGAARRGRAARAERVARHAGGAARAARAVHDAPRHGERGRRRAKLSGSRSSASSTRRSSPRWPAAGRRARARAAARAEPLPLSLPGRRARVRDRRGEGVAGVAGDLLASGEPVLVVCADVARRRGGPGERSPARPAPRRGANAAAGLLLDRAGRATRRSPGLRARGRPRPAGRTRRRRGRARVAPGPGEGGSPTWPGARAEVEFARAVARAALDLRPSLIGLYRALRDRPVAGADLERVLRGDGAQPRSPEVAARMVRVLRELGLVAYERDGAATRPAACSTRRGPRSRVGGLPGLRGAAGGGRAAAGDALPRREAVAARPAVAAAG